MRLKTILFFSSSRNKFSEHLEGIYAHGRKLNWHVQIIGGKMTRKLIRENLAFWNPAGVFVEYGEQALFTQPGMRYCQAEALVKSMLKDATFARADPAERDFVTERLLENVRGRMLEDIVLLETMAAFPKPRDIFDGKEVFKLMFDSGEFDMVVRDLRSGTCEICEIKHSREAVDEQFRHLVDPQKCAQVEALFGRISSRTVYYRGADFVHPDGIRYRNVESYLKSLCVG